MRVEGESRAGRWDAPDAQWQKKGAPRGAFVTKSPGTGAGQLVMSKVVLRSRMGR